MKSKGKYSKLKRKVYKLGTKKMNTSWGKTLADVANVAGTALQIGKFVASVVNPELKYKDHLYTLQPIDASGTILALTDLAEGSDNNQRNGRSIKAHDLMFRLNVTLNNSATVGYLRCILFIDNHCRGAVPAVTDVLEQATVLSPLNLTSQSDRRFTILKDFNLSMATGGANHAIFRKAYRKLGHHIRYIGTDGTASSLGSGNIFVLFISTDSTNKPSVDFFSRIKFYDN